MIYEELLCWEDSMNLTVQYDEAIDNPHWDWTWSLPDLERVSEGAILLKELDNAERFATTYHTAPRKNWQNRPIFSTTPSVPLSSLAKTCSQLRSEIMPLLLKDFTVFANCLISPCWHSVQRPLFTSSVSYLVIRNRFNNLRNLPRTTFEIRHRRTLKVLLRGFPNLDYLCLRGDTGHKLAGEKALKFLSNDLRVMECVLANSSFTEAWMIKELDRGLQYGASCSTSCSILFTAPRGKQRFIEHHTSCKCAGPVKLINVEKELQMTPTACSRPGCLWNRP